MIGQQNQVQVGGKVYTITKQIGQGAQGAVYKGLNQQGEEVAIKYQNTISDNEYQILQSLTQNPKANIIGIKAVQREMNGKTVMVMELADNELFKYMTENPEYQTLSKDQKNQIFYQMVQAVKELHDLGYFHRDLKPENFVVFKKDANGYVKTKLIDLGLCKQQQNQMRHTRNVGTPYYMAPEIFDGFLLYDHTVDSWALGCIWFELMTTQTFFQGTDPNSLFSNIRNATQQQIDQRIECQQIFNQEEKKLLKSLIKKNANQRIQVKLLAQELQANQNNNQTNPNFINNQQVNAFQPPIKQFPQFQNANNQPKFNINQQNPNNIQAFQQQQNQNQMNDWKQKQQQQMQQEYEQKLKIDVEKQKQIEIERIRKEVEQQQQKLFEEQKKQEEQNQIKLKQLEEELRKKNEEEQKKIELDKKKLQELQIEQEIKMQNQLEEQKKKLEEDQRKQQEELKRMADEKMQIELKQREEESQRRIAAQIQQQLLIEYNQKLQQKEEQEKGKVLSETKNKVKKLMKNSKEVIEKFIQNLEEKSQEKLITDSQSIIPQQYKEFQDMILSFVNQFKQKLIKIEENENAIDFQQLSQIQELENKLNESNQQFAQDQLNILNTITQKYNQLISQLMNQKQLKEQVENLQKQQTIELQQLYIQYQSYNEQIKVMQLNIENQQRNSEQFISQMDENEISNQSQQINQNISHINQQFQQFQQQAKEFINQEISIQIMKYKQMNSQLFRIIEELKQLMNQQQQLNSRAENKFQNLKAQTNEKILQFQDCMLRFDFGYQQLKKEIERLQSQGASALFLIKLKEFQSLVTQMETLLNQFENSLSQLQQNFNKNMMFQSQQLISDLTKKQNELTNLDTNIIQLHQQLERIINQYKKIVQLKEENKRNFVQWGQQQQTLVAQFQNFSYISVEIKQQIELLLKSFDNLKNEFIMALEQLNSQKQETEDQLRKFIDDNQRVSNAFMQKFEEKKSAAQVLLQTLHQFQAVQDEKQKLFNQFNIQCSQIKQILKQLKFDNSLQVFNQIKQFSCKESMEQCLEYFKQCEEKYNENSQVYNDLTKLLKGKNSFPIQKNKVREELNNLYNQSSQSINDLKSFYNWTIQPFLKEKFDQIEQLDDEHFSKLEKCREIQSRVENLSFENSDQFQKTLTSQIDDQEFMNKVQQNLKELTNYQIDLQQINFQEIQQFNFKIPNILNSWFIQILLITIILSYQKQELIKRKFSKAEAKGDQEQRQILLDEEKKTKDLMLKCQSYLDSKRFNELKSDDLIGNFRQTKESVDKDLNEIKTKNRVKLRGFVKKQNTIKEIIELTYVQEFNKNIYFNKLMNE